MVRNVIGKQVIKDMIIKFLSFVAVCLILALFVSAIVNRDNVSYSIFVTETLRVGLFGYIFGQIVWLFLILLAIVCITECMKKTKSN